MPDLDRLLAADADADRRLVADGDLSSLDTAFDRALRTTRYRRIRATALAAAAVAVVGAGTAWVVHPAGGQRHPARLAAYDHVLGPVPGDRGSGYVVGPKDDRTAHCTVVPGATVNIVRRQPDPAAPGSGALFYLTIDWGASESAIVGHIPRVEWVTDALRPGPYYVFRCRIGE